VIKRRPCLSASFGGLVTEIEGDSGRLRKITTYCRMYQKIPHRHGVLCEGIDSYPACPDLTTCRGRRPATQQDDE